MTLAAAADDRVCTLQNAFGSLNCISIHRHLSLQDREMIMVQQGLRRG